MLYSKLLAASVFCISSVAVADVKGLYQAACLEYPDQGLSMDRTINFKDGLLTQVRTVHADLSCSAPSYSFTFKGPYTITADGTLDFTMASLQLTALNSTVANNFQTAAICGFDNWEINAPREVAGLDCGGTKMPDGNSMTYDRVKEVEGGIVFGAVTGELDGSTAEKRPSAYDETQVFKVVRSELH